MNNWQPQPSDIEWTRRVIEGLNDGGVWGIPSHRSIWKVDKVKRLFSCIHGERDALFYKISIICALLDYTAVYAPDENMTQVQVQEHIEMTLLKEEMYGMGKSLVTTGGKPAKKYAWRPITPEDMANYRINLSKLPRRQRWKGRTEPQCDFCANEKPIVTYAAHRLTSGERQDCWRWLACIACHDAITRNDFTTIERRAVDGFTRLKADPKTAKFAFKMSFNVFHTDAIEI